MTQETSGPASVLAMPRSLSWAMALLFLVGTSVDQVHAKGSFQNGRINGAIYPGAVDYSNTDIFITGITYGTNGDSPAKEAQCFVSKMPSDGIGLHSEITSTALGDGTAMQSCHTISVLHEPSTPGLGSERPFVVGGTSDPEVGFGSTDQPSGFMVTFSQENKHGGFPVKNSLSTDEAGQTNMVSYPVSTRYVWGHDADGTGDRFNNNRERITYIASISSTNMDENPANAELMAGSADQPNWMKYYKFGTSFDLSLQKFSLQTMKSGEEEAWTKIYPIDVDPTTSAKPDVYVGGMILKRRAQKDFLIVAGSTSGMGEVYGTAVPGSTDEDGFIAVFSGHTGELRNLPTNQPDFKSTARPGTAETDLILGICDDPNDSNHFYIVGATGDAAGMGEQIRTNSAVLHAYPGSLHGFVQKINLNTLEKVWGKTWSANFGFGVAAKQSVTAGYGCKVISDGSIYVAGVVEDGAHVSRDVQLNHDFDDIVAMRLTSDGDVKWVKQFGSADGDEALARSGPVAVDSEENMVIVGDTKGSLYRKREDESDNTSDMFVVTLSKRHGKHDKTVPGDHIGEWFHEPSIPTPGSKDNDDQPKTGIFSGGKWKDDEVYGTTKWVDTAALGIQSGPTSGSVYAGGMVYDNNEDSVYVTGIAYNDAQADNILSSCMVTKLPLNKVGFNGWGSATGKVIGTDNVLEVCNSVALHGFGEVVAVGHADNGSSLQDGNAYPMAGFAIALDRFDLREVDETALVTKDPNNRIQYPIDVVSDGDDMYIVSLTSTDMQTTAEFQKLKEDGGHNGFSPNWINMNKYGSSFDMTVTKLTLRENKIDGVSMGDISFTTVWSKEFPISPDSDGTIPRAYLGGAILKKSQGYLALSGSTRGMGEGYGMARGNDEDGFVTLLDIDTGELATGVLKNNLREGTSEDDVVLGICHDPDDSSSFYIVGATQGTMPDATTTTVMTPGSTHAFLLKVDADSLHTIWTTQLGADGNGKDVTTAKAYDCAVSGDTVYAGGIVDDGAGIVFKERPRSSRGGDDVWLGSFSTNEYVTHNNTNVIFLLTESNRTYTIVLFIDLFSKIQRRNQLGTPDGFGWQ